MARAQTVETFGASRQRMAGLVMLVFVVAFVADVIIQWRGANGLLPMAVALFFGAVVWITSVRPVVVAYEDRLAVRNFLRDAHLDWAAIGGAAMRGDLVIEPVDGQHKPVKSVAVQARRPDRTQGMSGVRMSLGMRERDEVQLGEAQMHGPPRRGDHAKGAYAVERIEGWASEARARPGAPAAWQVRWAVPECVVFAATLAFLLAMIVVQILR
jgi:hypothetical protein